MPSPRAEGISTVGIVAVADDAYCTGPADVIYEFFERVRSRGATRRAQSSLEHGQGQGGQPTGRGRLYPQALLEAQGGELQGFKCVGAFVAPATEAGDAWRVAQLTAVLTKRLKQLERVNILEHARQKDGKNDFSKLRFDLIKTCAHAKPFYYMRCMPPHI
jgi:hypothetical protein